MSTLESTAPAHAAVPGRASHRGLRGLAARGGYGTYVAVRVGQAALVIALSYVLVFLGLAALPGDPVRAQLENPENGYTEADKAAVIAYWGLDRPILEQLITSVQHALGGDLGLSLTSRAPVTDIVLGALPSTLVLAGTALVIALLIALVIGVLSQRLPVGPLRSLVRSLPTVFLSTPNFVLGLVLIQLLAVQLGVFSVIEPDSPPATLVAALTLAIPVSAQIAQVLVTALDTARAEDFGDVATSRGVGDTAVILRHLLRPSLLPTVTVCGLVLGELLGGSLITETIFGRSGLGSVVSKAVSSQDVPVLQATVLISAAVFVLVNLVIDLAYPLLDPRLRTRKAAR